MADVIPPDMRVPLVAGKAAPVPQVAGAVACRRAVVPGAQHIAAERHRITRAVEEVEVVIGVDHAIGAAILAIARIARSGSVAQRIAAAEKREVRGRIVRV